MQTDQARRLVTLHDNIDRAIANLRNASAMAADDPRATELLETAGDAYAESLAALVTEQERVTHPLLKARVTTESGPEGAEAPADPEGFEPGVAVYIVEDGHGAGFIEDRGDMKPGFLPIRLTTPAHFRGQDFPPEHTIAVAVDCLSLEPPADATSATEQGEDASGKGGVAPSA